MSEAPRPLAGTVAIVTGASRGVGRGVAVGLGEAGATVYATARTLDDRDERSGDAPGTLADTAREVAAVDGECIPVRCDHRDDEAVSALFRQVRREAGRLDVLVNSAWGGYEALFAPDGSFVGDRPFWQQPFERWDSMLGSGVRAAYVASCMATPMLIANGGLIVHISYWAARKYMLNVAYGVAKAATDRLTADMAHELERHGVTVVSLYPGLVRTERVLMAAGAFDLSNSESPQFSGRAVAALAADEQRLVKTGRALVSAELALEYGFTDVDGSQPRPLTLETA